MGVNLKSLRCNQLLVGRALQDGIARNPKASLILFEMWLRVNKRIKTLEQGVSGFQGFRAERN
jgi:hypothetical protein